MEYKRPAVTHAIVGIVLIAIITWGCSGEPVNSSPQLAASKAFDYVRLAYVDGDARTAYVLLSDDAKAAQSLEQFTTALESARSGGAPDSVRVTGYEMSMDDDLMLIYLSGKAADREFYYQATLEGSITAGYGIDSIVEKGTPFSHGDMWTPLELSHQ